jgi:hypothetical protein
MASFEEFKGDGTGKIPSGHISVLSVRRRTQPAILYYKVRLKKPSPAPQPARFFGLARNPSYFEFPGQIKMASAAANAFLLKALDTAYQFEGRGPVYCSLRRPSPASANGLLAPGPLTSCLEFPPAPSTPLKRRPGTARRSFRCSYSPGRDTQSSMACVASRGISYVHLDDPAAPNERSCPASVPPRRDYKWTYPNWMDAAAGFEVVYFGSAAIGSVWALNLSPGWSVPQCR